MTMMLKDRKLAWAGFRSFFPIMVVIAFAIISCVWYATRLVLAIVPQGGQAPVCFTVQPGDQWKISLTHSVELSPWEDYFTINGPHDLTMTHTVFQSLGWGYPYSPDDGKLSHTEDGRFTMVMNRPYKDLSLRISEQAMQQIIYKDQAYDLIGLYGQGAVVQVKAQYRYEYWLDTYL